MDDDMPELVSDSDSDSSSGSHLLCLAVLDGYLYSTPEGDFTGRCSASAL
jgi:hypothetical protein